MEMKSFRRIALLVVFTSICSVGAGIAQETGERVEDESTAYEGIVVGKGLLRPSFEAIVEADDNIFLTKDNKVDDIIYVARPKIEYEVPFRQSSFKVGALLQYKDFKDYELNENWSPIGSFDLLLRFSNGFSLEVGDRVLSGTLEVDEIDPGFEVLFGDERFRKNTANVALRYDWDTRNGFGISSKYDSLAFDQATDLFYDYDTFVAGASYYHKFSPLAEFNVSANYIEWTHGDEFRFRDSDGGEVLFGVKGSLTQTLSGSVRLGYRNLDFANNDLSNEGFSSFVTELDLVQELANHASLSFLASRSANQSNYAADVNYFTSTRGGIEYNQRIDKFFFTLGGTYQANNYATSGLLTSADRDDKILNAKVSVGYYFMKTLSLRANYRYQDRGSNLDEFDYTTNSYLLALRVGY